MKCEEVRQLLDPLMDRELPERERAAVERHLAECHGCRQERDALNVVSARLKSVPRHPLPGDLEESVKLALRGERAGAPQRTAASRRLAPVLTHAMALMAGAVIMFLVLDHAREQPVVADQILSAHIRSLMDRRLVQVASADPHSIAPWFSGKVDFAPDVRNLSKSGFPLLGGRVDYLAGRHVAALVYGRRKHRINVFIAPGTKLGTRPPARWRSKGYTLLGWLADGFAYWAISDLNERELTQFRNLLMDEATE